MFILDPGSQIRIFPSRIPDTGSGVKKIPDPGSASKKLSIFNPKLGNMIQKVYPGSGSQTRILIFYQSRIPDSGVKKAPDPGSLIWNRNTVWLIHFYKILGCHL
jgi:hypothetical protein